MKLLLSLLKIFSQNLGLDFIFKLSQYNFSLIWNFLDQVYIYLS